MAKKGATILDKMYDANDSNVFFEPNAAMHVKYADGVSQKMKQIIDEFIIANNLSAPPPHYDQADIPDVDAACASSITILNLPQNNIRSIIWSTGFNVDFNYIKLPVFNQEGKLMHKDGIPAIPGFYLLGYPWLRTRKSPILFGIKDDAKFIVDRIYNYSRENSHSGGMVV
jgi:putative flavoprotein involved in K+ transport